MTMKKSKEERKAEKARAQEERNAKARDFGKRVGERIHLAEKVAKAQRWVDRNPVTTAFSMITVMVILTISGVLGDFALNNDNTISRLEDITRMSKTMESLKAIDANRRTERELLSTLGETAFALKEKYDSLSGLERLSHEDSVELKTVAFKLNYFIKQFKGNSINTQQQ